MLTRPLFYDDILAKNYLRKFLTMTGAGMCIGVS